MVENTSSRICEVEVWRMSTLSIITADKFRSILDMVCVQFGDTLRAIFYLSKLFYNFFKRIKNPTWIIFPSTSDVSTRVGYRCSFPLSSSDELPLDILLLALPLAVVTRSAGLGLFWELVSLISAFTGDCWKCSGFWTPPKSFKLLLLGGLSPVSSVGDANPLLQPRLSASDSGALVLVVITFTSSKLLSTLVVWIVVPAAGTSIGVWWIMGTMGVAGAGIAAAACRAASSSCLRVAFARFLAWYCRRRACGEAPHTYSSLSSVIINCWWGELLI